MSQDGSMAMMPDKKKEMVFESIDDLKNQRMEVHQEIMEQKQCLKMMIKDREEKIQEMVQFASRRQDMQKEQRGKRKILEKKIEQRDRING